MKSFRVMSAILNPDSGMIEVVKEITNDDNSTELNLHGFHPETIEWKAAELGLEDIDEIIDSILYEPFVEDVRPLQMSVNEARSIHRTRISDAKQKFSPKVVMPAAAMKERLIMAGVGQKYIDAVDNDPIDVIKNNCPFHAEVIEVKTEHIDNVRKNVSSNVRSKQSGAERASRLRAHLFPGARRDKQYDPAKIDHKPNPPIILGQGRSDKT